jgi:hypothetical protein
MRTCECGRNIYPKRNSTIYPKECPSCQLSNVLKTKQSKSKPTGQRQPPVKWRDKTTSDMIIHVQEKIVNPYIRERDNEIWHGKSISDNGRISDAGHYYSVGAKPGLRFCVQNIHGQSASGNRFKGSDAINYRIGLVKRYGEDYVKELDQLAMLSEGVRSLDRYNVILIAETYLYLKKERIWVFWHKEFEKYKMELVKMIRV